MAGAVTIMLFSSSCGLVAAFIVIEGVMWPTAPKATKWWKGYRRNVLMLRMSCGVEAAALRVNPSATYKYASPVGSSFVGDGAGRLSADTSSEQATSELVGWK